MKPRAGGDVTAALCSAAVGVGWQWFLAVFSSASQSLGVIQ